MNRDYTDRTIQTARWAREQIKRQTGRFTLHFIERPGRNFVPGGGFAFPSAGAQTRYGSDSGSEKGFGDEDLYE